METKLHADRYTVEHGGIGHGWFVVAHYAVGHRAVAAGPYTSKAQADHRAKELRGVR